MDSKPSKLVKGVSLQMSITLAVNAEGIFEASPPPVFFCSFASSLNSYLACECKFRHFHRTSAVVRIATPTAFTASAIFFHISIFFWLINLLCISERFSSTFSIKTAISEVLAGEAIMQRSQLHCTKSLLWDANCQLNALIPMLANLFSNCTSNDAILKRFNKLMVRKFNIW